MDAAANWVTSIGGVVAISSAIALSGLIVALKFSYVTRGLLKSIKQANEKLSSYGNPSAFADSFEEFNQWVEHSELLSDTWNQFRVALILPDPDTQSPQIIQKSIGAEALFQDETIIHPRINMRFYNAMPNYLTGGGILGTFIGLVAGIYLANQGLASSDVTQMRGALSGLLGGAWTAFITSIVGLSCSIPFSIYEKARTARLHNDLAIFRRLLNALIVTVTPEKLAYDSYLESVNQSAELKRFNTDLAISIASALDEKITGRLVPSLDKLIAAVEGLRSDRSSTNEEILRQMVHDFKATLTQAANRDMKELSEAIRDVMNNLQRVGDNILTASEAMDTSRQCFLDGLEGSLVAFEKGTEDISKHMLSAFSVLEDTVKQLGTTIEQAGKVVYDITEIGDWWRSALQDATSHVRASLLAFQDSYARLEGALNATVKVHDGLQPLIVGLEHGVTTMQETAASFRESSQTLRVHGIEVNEIWENQARRFQGLDGNLGRTFLAINDGVLAYTQQVRSFMMEIDKLFSDALGSLSGAVQELSLTVEQRSGDQDESAVPRT